MATSHEVFLDTSFSIALLLRTDEDHSRARAVAARIRSRRDLMVTTSAVTFELASALSRNPFRPLAVGFIDQLHNDPAVALIVPDERLIEAGYELFVRHAEKSWTLVDCISFVVMRERGITEALTADRHFVQAGFRALLLEDG